MRDDLSSLFEDLLSCYNSKKDILEQIILNETQLRHFLGSDNTDSLGSLVQADNDLFAGLDSVEFDIQSTIDKICRKTGIHKSEFEKYFKSRKEEIAGKVFQQIENTKKKMYELIKDRDSLIGQMEEKLKEMRNDINTLNLTRRLKH